LWLNTNIMTFRWLFDGIMWDVPPTECGRVPDPTEGWIHQPSEVGHALAVSPERSLGQNRPRQP
jgi:hypothetical protein